MSTSYERAMAKLRAAQKEAVIAWSVCASIHREFGKGRDALYTTRQADFVKHEAVARAALDDAASAIEIPEHDHTERARQVLDRWCGSHLHHFIPVDPSKGEDPAAYLELHDLITDALSAVRTEYLDVIRGMGVTEDQELIAALWERGREYEAETRAALLARLQDPAVRQAVIDALMTTGGWVSSFPGRRVAAALTDAAIAKIEEMLK